MSDTTNFSIQFSAVDSDTGDEKALSMYQEVDNDLLGYPSYADISNMITYVKSGISAYQIFKNNPYASIKGDNVEITLPFFVRMNPKDLAYSFTTNVTAISERTIIEKEYKSTVVVPMSNKVTFPGEVTISSLEWKSPAYNSKGNIVNTPNYSLSGNVLSLSSTIFAVLKISYTVLEHAYVAKIVIPKTEISEYGDRIDNEITGLTPIIMATYTDDDGETQTEKLELIYPEIVTSFLETCPDTSDGLKIDFGTSSINKDTTTRYYYSTCTGEILGIVRK